MTKCNKEVQTSSIKNILCNILITVKDECGFTYEDLIELSKPVVVNKSQLGRILNDNGQGVSCDLISNILNELGYNLEVSVYNTRLREYL